MRTDVNVWDLLNISSIDEESSRYKVAYKTCLKRVLTEVSTIKHAELLSLLRPINTHDAFPIDLAEWYQHCQRFASVIV